MSAATVSVSVAPPFSTMIELIVCLSVIVVPNLKRTASHMYSPYWTSSGRSKPSAALRSSTCAGESFPPRVAEIGSPGATRIMRNTTVNRTKIMGIISAIRIRT